MELYAAAARADENGDGFADALADLCRRHRLDRWEDFVSPDQQRQFFKDERAPLAQRIIAFW